jgi:hypothetical protein
VSQQLWQISSRWRGRHARSASHERKSAKCFVIVDGTSFATRPDMKPALMLLLGTMACDAPTATSTTTSTRVDARDANEDVIVSITAARCHRQVNCDNVGAGRRYVDDAACLREVGQNTRPTMRESACRVVDTSALKSCLDTLENEECGNPVALERITACRNSALCTPQD